MITFFQRGGLLIYPLLACSVVALAIIIERLFHFRGDRRRNQESYEIIIPLVEGGLFQKARDACVRKPGIFTNIILAALDVRSQGRDEVKEAILDAGRQEIPKLERHLVFLGTIAGITPLLGLLGTVSGMIKIFSVIAELGVGQANALSEGISEALYTTALGLSVAIPALVMHNYLREKAENSILDIEKRTIQVMNHLFRKDGMEPAGRSAYSDRTKIREVEN
ncbi:MAG: MotA/TolQ/ExbB proton channel family protein [Acidobacteria bacterium]|nr:MotA/TolQ/ExbB proton channel family protein [Acidobacteriota bacterium]